MQEKAFTTVSSTLLYATQPYEELNLGEDLIFQIRSQEFVHSYALS